MTDPSPSFARTLEESFAERLERAIAAAESRGSKVTNKGLAEQLVGLGIEVTESHLSHLRRGRSDRPSAWLVAGLAKILEVPISYFAPEDPRSQEESTNIGLKSLGPAGHTLLWNAVGLSNASLDVCLALLAHLRHLEGLTADSGAKRGQR